LLLPGLDRCQIALFQLVLDLCITQFALGNIPLKQLSELLDMRAAIKANMISIDY
jgi:hypothetical protein